jgi:hypothetical protein
MAVTLTLQAPHDTWSGTIPIPGGGNIVFDTGSATVSQANDPRSPQPMGARLQAILDAIRGRLGSNTVLIDGETPSAYMLANFGRQVFN